MTGTEVKAVLRDHAAACGYELVHSNLRSNFFHVRNGTKVCLGFVWRGIDTASIKDAVESAIGFGKRLDKVPQSAYYVK
jgi:hypothetical protein